VFLPEPLAGFEPTLAAATVGVVSDAERRLQRLGTGSTAAFGRDEIVAIHRQLMTAAPNARVAGRIRTVRNWIGGNDHNPCGADLVTPPPEQVEPLLADLCDAMADESLPPLVQAELVHAQFETIHPFDDGNGRTGRTLIHVVLRRRGLAEVAQLTERWRAMLRATTNPRADAAAWAIIDVLPAQPVVTSAIAGAVTGRAKAATHNALEQLADAGVLVPIAGGRRSRSWEAAGLLDLIADLEAGELPT